MDSTDTTYYTFQQWEDIIVELDNYDGLLPGRAPEFISSLLERQPKVLSAGQVKWLEDLKERYLA